MTGRKNYKNKKNLCIKTVKKNKTPGKYYDGKV